ncbi:MAG: hypothetical protein D6746_16240 [Bacteroidetes bacterium]|nr:MAG: hypothetical protein D6746_16240 [Bacteroidota bacterium]
MDPHDHLWVYDRNNARISRFAGDGTLLNTYPAPPITSTVKVAAFDSSHLALFLEISEGQQDDNLFKLFSPDFSTIQARFGSVEAVWKADNVLERILLARDPGRFVVADGEIVYVPTLYTGTLYRYKSVAGR